MNRSQSDLKSRQNEFNEAITELEVQTVSAAPLLGSSVPSSDLQHQLTEAKRRLDEVVGELERVRREEGRKLEESTRNMKKAHHDEINKLMADHEAEMNRWKQIMERSLSELKSTS